MGSISYPSATLFTNSPPFLRELAHISIPKVKFHNANMPCISHVTYPQRVCFKGNGSIRIGRAGVACGAKESGSGEEPGALETVLKLYEAMKNKDVSKISDIIAEECLCSSNFVSTFKPFHGKKQVLGFFSSLMKNMGNDIEFVVQHTYDDGILVGVTWKLEWKKVRLPLGKGFSIHTCHVYQGKVMIKNVEIFIKPLLHVEPLRLKIISLVMNAMEKLNPQALFKNKARKAVKVLFILFFVAAIAFVLKHRMST